MSAPVILATFSDSDSDDAPPTKNTVTPMTSTPQVTPTAPTSKVTPTSTTSQVTVAPTASKVTPTPVAAPSSKPESVEDKSVNKFYGKEEKKENTNEKQSAVVTSGGAVSSSAPAPTSTSSTSLTTMKKEDRQEIQNQSIMDALKKCREKKGDKAAHLDLINRLSGKTDAAREKAREERLEKIEQFTHLEIENRHIQRARWESMMSNKRYLSFDELRNYKAKDIKTGKQEVIIGILYDKLPAKTASSGNSYVSWQFTQLMAGAQPVEVTLQLYDDAFRSWNQDAEHAKKAKIGSIFAILDPKILENRANFNGPHAKSFKVTTTASMGMQLNKLGDFPHLAFCKILRDKDGLKCGRPVRNNIANTMCNEHRTKLVQRNPKIAKMLKSDPKLMERCNLQGINQKKTDQEPGLTNFIPGSLNTSHLDKLLSVKTTQETKKEDPNEKKAQEKLKQQQLRYKQIDFMEKLKGAQRTGVNRHAAQAQMDKRPDEILTSHVSLRPHLGRDFGKDKDEDVVISISSNDKIDERIKRKIMEAKAAEEKAAKKKKEEAVVPVFAKLDPNNPMANKKRMREQFGDFGLSSERSGVRKRIDLIAEDKKEREETAKEVHGSRARLLAEKPKSETELRQNFEKKFGKTEAEKMIKLQEDKEAIRNAKSKHADLITMQQMSERRRIGQELEFRDEMDAEKEKVTHIDVKVWTCEQCKCCTDVPKAKIVCIEAGHMVREKSMSKTRWECRRCGQSAFQLGKGMPSKCGHCRNDTFKSASFYKVRRAAMEKDCVELRGADHDRYLNHEQKQRTMGTAEDKDMYAGLDNY